MNWKSFFKGFFDGFTLKFLHDIELTQPVKKSCIESTYHSVIKENENGDDSIHPLP
jgi:hypothetical protein